MPRRMIDISVPLKAGIAFNKAKALDPKYDPDAQ